MSKTEIFLYNELTELIYSKIAYYTALVRKRNEMTRALLHSLCSFRKPALFINRFLTATVYYCG